MAISHPHSIKFFGMFFQEERGFPGGSDGKESACNAGDTASWVGKIHRKRKWLPIPVFLPEEFHGERSLVGYNTVHVIAKSWT